MIHYLPFILLIIIPCERPLMGTGAMFADMCVRCLQRKLKKKRKEKRNVLEQEMLLPMRPACLRQKNVKKKECLPPPQRGLRLGLIINLPKLTFSWPHELYHARLFCPPLSPGVCSDSCPLGWWCYLTISPSAAPFTFCLQYFPGSFPMSRLLSSNL